MKAKIRRDEISERVTLKGIHEILLFRDPQASSFGGRFFPRFFTHSCLLIFRLFCAALFMWHVMDSEESAQRLFRTWTFGLFCVFHVAVWLSVKRISSHRTVVKIQLCQTVLDVGFGAAMATAYPSCEVLALIFFFIPVTQASLFGPPQAWLAASFLAIGVGCAFVLWMPNVPSTFALVVLTALAFIMRAYRGTQIKLMTDAAQARSRYESLVEHIPQMITRKNLEGVITFANDAFCKLNCLTIEEALETTDEKLYGSQAAAKYAADDKKVMETKEILQISEKHRPFRAAREMDVEGTKIPVFDSNGNVVEIQVIFWDVTERKQREVQLEALMRSTGDFIYFKDIENRFRLISNALAGQLGLSSPRDAIGRSDSDFFPADYAQAASDYERRLMTTGQVENDIEEHGYWPNGNEFWVSTKKDGLRDGDGQLIGTFGISRDISHRKYNEASLKEAHRRLIESQDELKKAHSRLDLQLDHASKIARFGFWEWDLLSDGPISVKATDELYRIFNLTPQQHGIKLSDLRNLVHPEDCHIWDKNFSITADFGKTFAPFELRLRFPDGTIKHLHAKAEVGKRDADTLPETIVGFIQDVTDRKKNEMRIPGLELIIRGFQHMVPGSADEASSALETASFPDMNELPIAKALCFIFLIRHKSDEVRSLLDEKSAFKSHSLNDIWRHAWPIAVDLAKMDCADLQIIYDSDAHKDLLVNGALYTAAVNILSNARQHGRPPFVIWITSGEAKLNVIFGDGGPRRKRNPIENESAFAVRQRLGPVGGTGLPLAKRILAFVGATIQKLESSDSLAEFGLQPKELRQCETLFHVQMPLE